MKFQHKQLTFVSGKSLYSLNRFTPKQSKSEPEFFQNYFEQNSHTHTKRSLKIKGQWLVTAKS
jgi:hypothetical protein